MPQPSQKHQVCSTMMCCALWCTTLSPGTSVHKMEHNSCGLPVVDVVVDPRLAHLLKPHQKEGVTFLYECIMGTRDFQGHGAILA